MDIKIVIDDNRLRRDLLNFEKEGFYNTNCEWDEEGDGLYHRWFESCKAFYLTPYWFELESIKFEVQDMLYAAFTDQSLIDKYWHFFLKQNEQILTDLCL